MNEDKVPKSQDMFSPKNNLAVRIDFLKMRLDHTLNHLQTASKLIYLVDGAVLAFVYFLVNALGFTRSIAFFLAVVSFILAGLNFLHSQFILTQQHWYRQIDLRIRKWLEEDELDRIPDNKYTKNLFTSSHRNLKHIHVWIAFWLIIVTFFLLLYSVGFFEEIHIKNIKQCAKMFMIDKS